MRTKLAKVWKFLKMVNFKTIYFNFKYFPAEVAIHFPILISRNVILKDCKGSIHIDAPIRTGMIAIGYGDVTLFDRNRSKSILQFFGRIIFKGRAIIGHGSKISVAEAGILTFGDRFEISAESSIICYHEISFGDGCLVSWEVLFMDTDLHKIYNTAQEIINFDKAINIGKNVWIGCRCTILKGSVIPEGTIIAAGSVISRPLDRIKCIYGAHPTRVLKEGISWKH